MKRSKNSKKFAAKGDRLNWTPLKDVKPVRLTRASISGRFLTEKDLNASNNNKQIAGNIFIP
jgi:hypothetical protein